MGAPYREQVNGAVFVVFGPAEQGDSVAEADLQFFPFREHSLFGSTVHFLDVDADGQVDLLTSAPEDSSTNSNQGAIFTAYGPIVEPSSFDAVLYGEDEQIFLSTSMALGSDSLFLGASLAETGQIIELVQQ